MKQIVILRGPCGCGKSSWAAKQYPKAVVVSADDFWLVRCKNQGMHSDSRFPVINKNGILYEYIFDPTKLAEAHARCLARFLVALDEKQETIVVDNTNIFVWQYRPYEIAARLAGYGVQIVEWRPMTIADLKLCASRNCHRTPIEVVAKMCYEFEPSNDRNAMEMDIEEAKR